MERSRSIALVFRCWENLKASGMFDSNADPYEHTIILGDGALFDPPRFVAFMSIIEDNLKDEFAKADFVLVLKDLNTFNKGNRVLTLGTLIDFVVALANNQST